MSFDRAYYALELIRLSTNQLQLKYDNEMNLYSAGRLTTFPKPPTPSEILTYARELITFVNPS